jgi:NADH:ubiquinone oxidoreductase subunit K
MNIYIALMGLALEFIGFSGLITTINPIMVPISLLLMFIGAGLIYVSIDDPYD